VDQGALPLVKEKAPKPEQEKPLLRVHAKADNPLCAMVLGGAECVWEDVAKLEAIMGRPWDGLVIAVNDIGSHWPHRIDHWCTLHPEKLAAWMGARKKNGHSDGYITWTRDNRVRRGKGTPEVPHRQIGSGKGQIQGGASGMLAVAVAYELKCTHVVLCGVPMDRTPHFAESTVHQKGRIWNSSQSHLRAWQKQDVLSKLKGRCKSMSGETLKLLGAPDRAWLADCLSCKVAA
jgi:hypothetical protein